MIFGEASVSICVGAPALSRRCVGPGALCVGFRHSPALCVGPGALCSGPPILLWAPCSLCRAPAAIRAPPILSCESHPSAPRPSAIHPGLTGHPPIGPAGPQLQPACHPSGRGSLHTSDHRSAGLPLRSACHPSSVSFSRRENPKPYCLGESRLNRRLGLIVDCSMEAAWGY